MGDPVVDVAGPGSEPIRVLVADAQPRTRARVRDTLEPDRGFVICAESATADQTVAAAAAAEPDVCLVGIDLPGGGISAVTRIVAMRPSTAAIMLAVSRRDSDLFDSLRAGASGYLLMDGIELELADAVRRVFAGEASLAGILVARLIEEFRDRQVRRVRIVDGQAARLTGREWDVLELLREGLSTAEMADRLFVSRTTIRSHVAAVLHKLRVPDREAAVRLLGQT